MFMCTQYAGLIVFLMITFAIATLLLCVCKKEGPARQTKMSLAYAVLFYYYSIARLYSASFRSEEKAHGVCRWEN